MSTCTVAAWTVCPGRFARAVDVVRAPFVPAFAPPEACPQPRHLVQKWRRRQRAHRPPLRTPRCSVSRRAGAPRDRDQGPRGGGGTARHLPQLPRPLHALLPLQRRWRDGAVESCRALGCTQCVCPPLPAPAPAETKPTRDTCLARGAEGRRARRTRRALHAPFAAPFATPPAALFRRLRRRRPLGRTAHAMHER